MVLCLLAFIICTFILYNVCQFLFVERTSRSEVMAKQVCIPPQDVMSSQALPRSLSIPLLIVVQGLQQDFHKI